MQKRELTMIDELCELEEGLAPHELQFVEDMSHKPDTYKMSEKQLEWLERLWSTHVLKKFNR